MSPFARGLLGQAVRLCLLTAKKLNPQVTGLVCVFVHQQTSEYVHVSLYVDDEENDGVLADKTPKLLRTAADKCEQQRRNERTNFQ